MRQPKHHRAAHRMGKCKMRWRTIGQHHLPHEGLDVDLVIGKVADIALARVAQPPRRVPLPAPVDHRHRKTAIAQVAHRLEIFLDLLAAPREDADRTLAARGRRPARKAQFGPVRRADGAADDVVGNGICGNRDKRHGAVSARCKGREIKGRKVEKRLFRVLLNAVSPVPISFSCRPLPVFRVPRI